MHGTRSPNYPILIFKRKGVNVYYIKIHTSINYYSDDLAFILYHKHHTFSIVNLKHTIKSGGSKLPP